MAYHKKFVFTAEHQAEISEWKEKIKDKKLYCKIEVLDYAAKGYEIADIIRLTGYARCTINCFIREYAKNGIGYFTADHRYNRVIPLEEERRIDAKFKEIARKKRFIHVNDIQKEYAKALGKAGRETVSRHTFYCFLSRTGWKPIVPQSKYLTTK